MTHDSNHSHDRRPRFGSLAYSLLIVLACIAPIVGLILTIMVVPDEVAALNPAVQPVTSQVRLVDVDDAHAASAKLTWAEGPRAVSPAWTGLVTSVSVTAGQTLRSGTLVARIEGVDRVAVYSPQPFHRSLTAGQSGVDVAMLRKALNNLGYKVKAVQRDDLFDAPMTSAVRQLEARLSGTKPSAAAAVFQPSWFIWLPIEPVLLHEVKLVVGQRAPAQGEAAAIGAPILAKLTVSLPDSVRLRNERYEFAYAGAAVSLDPSLVARDEALTAVSKLVVPGVESVEGQIRLSAKKSALMVPVSAVQSNAAGVLCVHLRVNEQYVATTVTVTGGGIGTAEITAGLKAGDEVVANPAQMGLRCES